MKNYLLILLFFSSFLTKTSISQISDNQVNYINSNPDKLIDESGTNIFTSPGNDSLVFTGETTGGYYGRSVSSAGDVNGDGYSDIIVGAENIYAESGRAYIFFGGISMDIIADLTLNGEGGVSHFGVSVSSAGDVNADGYSDVIVGADNIFSATGRAYIFFGGIAMDNTSDLTLNGESANSNFGAKVSSAGDVNDDGFSDVIVGAYKYNNLGRAYIFYGGLGMNNTPDVIMTGGSSGNIFGCSVSSAGDLNGDGYTDVIVGDWYFNGHTGRASIYFGGVIMNNIADLILTGETTDNAFGISVSIAGDINSDGYSDVIVGASGYNFNKGRTYIFYGGVAMNNIADLVLTGEAEGSYFGVSVSTAGDISGDGVSDVIVGAQGSDIASGHAYIFYGGNDVNNIADLILTGETIYTNFGYSVSTAGDVNGSGYPSVLVGAFSFNQYTGRVYLFLNLTNPVLISPSNNSSYNPLNLNFIWKKVTPSLKYILNVSTDSIFNDIIVNDTVFIDTTKLVIGLQKGTRYFWKVRAVYLSGHSLSSKVWSFSTIPFTTINMKVLSEGLYSPVFNQLARKDSIKVYLRNTSPPYEIIDSAKSVIDSISLSGIFIFINVSSGTYYLVVKNLNNIETWSKAGGENLFPDSIAFNYDFTSSNTQAYLNNLKLKGSKYCIYSGDVNQDGFIDLLDVVPIYNDAINFITGNYLPEDLTGDNIIDLADVTLCYNNSTNFIRLRRP